MPGLPIAGATGLTCRCSPLLAPALAPLLLVPEVRLDRLKQVKTGTKSIKHSETRESENVIVVHGFFFLPKTVARF